MPRTARPTGRVAVEDQLDLDPTEVDQIGKQIVLETKFPLEKGIYALDFESTCVN